MKHIDPPVANRQGERDSLPSTEDYAHRLISQGTDHDGRKPIPRSVRWPRILKPRPIPARAVKLTDYRGKKVILYFYPKDDTPGCTKQACGFRDNYATVEEKNTIVLGVSPDDEA